MRFFAPEATLGKLQVGQVVTVHCDGCSHDVNAKINYMSQQAEYTPPVIYSKDSQAKLVFLVEAQPVELRDASLLHPGQPVSVKFQ